MSLQVSDNKDDITLTEEKLDNTNSEGEYFFVILFYVTTEPLQIAKRTQFSIPAYLTRFHPKIRILYFT